MVEFTEPKNRVEYQFGIKRTLLDTPEGLQCEECEGPTQKITGKYRAWGVNSVAVCNDAPIHQCIGECKTSWYDPQTILELLAGAARALPLTEQASRKRLISDARKMRSYFQ